MALKAYHDWYYEVEGGYYYVKKSPEGPCLTKCDSLRDAKRYIDEENSILAKSLPPWMVGLVRVSAKHNTSCRSNDKKIRAAAKNVRKQKRRTIMLATAHTFNKSVKELIDKS